MAEKDDLAKKIAGLPADVRAQYFPSTRPISTSESHTDDSSGYNEFKYFQAPGFYGVFEPHERRSLGERAFIRQKRQATEALKSGYDLVVHMENGTSLSGSRKKVYAKAFNGDKASIQIVRDAIKKESDGYVIDELELFFALHKASSATRTGTVEGILESPPPSMDVAFFIKALDLLAEVDESDDKKLAAISYIMGSNLIRDIRSARQILDVTATKKNPYMLLTRGTAHIGMLHALQLLSERDGQATFPDIPTVPFKLADTKSNAPIVKALWDRNLWATVIDQTQSGRNIMLDKVASDLHRSVVSDLHTGSLRHIPREVLAQIPSSPTEQDELTKLDLSF